MWIEDDGVSFNPITGLDATKVSARSHVGSYVFDEFRRHFGERLNVVHTRVSSAGGDFNRLAFNFGQATSTLGISPTEVFVDLGFGDRETAEKMAASISIPTDGSDLLIVISECFALSGLVMFVERIKQRLPTTMRVIFSFPKDMILNVVPRLFDDPRILFIYR